LNDGSEQCDTDFGALKLVLKLVSVNIQNPIPIGVETSTQNATDIMKKLQNGIDGLSNKNIHYFSHNKILGQFMALTIICPDLSNMLLSLLSSHCDGKNLPSIPPQKPVPPKKLFVIGENEKLPYMVKSLSADNPSMEVKQFKSNEQEQFAKDLARSGDENTIAIILSDSAVTPENYDANVFLTLIELSAKCGMKDRKFKIIAEILDPNNQRSLEKFNVQNIIISTHIISLFASKLLTDFASEPTLEELFSYEYARKFLVSGKSSQPGN